MRSWQSGAAISPTIRTGSSPPPSSTGGQLSSKTLPVEVFIRRWYQTLESADDRRDLLLQRIGVERLHDVVVDAGFLGGDHVFGLALCGDHDEGRGVQLVVGPDLLQELK